MPYKILSLLTIVFDEDAFIKCKKYHIYCAKIRIPNSLNSINTSYKNRVWLMKCITFYSFIRNNISILFIDSDIVFLQKCLSTLINNNNDIALLKSQPSQIFGYAGIVYNMLFYL